MPKRGLLCKGTGLFGDLFHEEEEKKPEKQNISHMLRHGIVHSIAPSNSKSRGKDDINFPKYCGEGSYPTS